MREMLKHPTVSAIIGTVVGTAIATPIVAIINSTNFFEAFILIYTWLKKVATVLLTYQFPLWIILIVLSLYTVIKKFTKKINVENVKQSIETHYRKDIIDEILWIFEWFQDFDGKIKLSVESPHPICPECMNDLVLSNTSSDGYRSPYPTSFVCENCGFLKQFGNSHSDYQEKIRREIVRRVRTGEWRNSLIKQSS